MIHKTVALTNEAHEQLQQKAKRAKKPEELVLQELLEEALRKSSGEKTQQPKFTVDSVFGSVQPSTRTEDIDRYIREAKEEKAARDV